MGILAPILAESTTTISPIEPPTHLERAIDALLMAHVAAVLDGDADFTRLVEMALLHAGHRLARQARL